MHIYYKRLFNPSLKEVNFTFADIAINQGIEFLDDFLSKKLLDAENFENVVDYMLDQLN